MVWEETGRTTFRAFWVLQIRDLRQIQALIENWSMMISQSHNPLQELLQYHQPRTKYKNE
jgi:hypothetical protein